MSLCEIIGGIMKVESWEVSDEFWSRVKPLIPKAERDPFKEYKRAPGAGRRKKSSRLIFEAIVYVLRTGCQWKALPSERFGSSSSIHQSKRRSKHLCADKGYSSAEAEKIMISHDYIPHVKSRGQEAKEIKADPAKKK